MTDFEKSVFRTLSLGGLVGFVVCLSIAYLAESHALAIVSMIACAIGAFAAFIWFIRASVKSLRDYGLGEGAANLYGKKTAEFMFGKNYKKPKDD